MLDILRRYDGRVRWSSEPDRGQAEAVNKGLRAAGGDILGWVNSDDLLMPGTLERVARTFESHPEALWLHGACEIIDARDRPIRRWISRYKDRRCRRYSYESLLLENYVSQMTVFWRREATDRVGLLDESLRYAFDFDLWLRFGKLGSPVYLGETLAAFRWYPTSKSGALYARQFAEDFAVFQRHAPPDRLLRARKRLRTARILAVYRLMGALRRSD